MGAWWEMTLKQSKKTRKKSAKNKAWKKRKKFLKQRILCCSNCCWVNSLTYDWREHDWLCLAFCQEIRDVQAELKLSLQQESHDITGMLLSHIGQDKESECFFMFVCMCVCMLVCVCACERGCVCVDVCVCAQAYYYMNILCDGEFCERVAPPSSHAHAFAHSCKVSWHQIWNNEKHLACVYMVTSEKKMGSPLSISWRRHPVNQTVGIKTRCLLSHLWCWRKIMSCSGHTTVEWLRPARLATGMAAALHHCQWPVLHLLL